MYATSVKKHDMAFVFKFAAASDEVSQRLEGTKEIEWAVRYSNTDVLLVPARRRSRLAACLATALSEHDR